MLNRKIEFSSSSDLLSLASDSGKIERLRSLLTTSRVTRALLLLMTLVLPFTGAGAQALPAGFSAEVVVTGLNDPTNLVTLPNGNMIVVQKAGRVRMFDPSSIPAQKINVLTLNVSSVDFARERGVASIALDPDFENNGYFYLYYTQQINDNRNRIARFTMVNGVANPNTETLVWEDNEPHIDCCHYGGGMDFGPDGMLYLATGEEFDGPQAQDLSRAGGKVIRVDPSQIDTLGPWVRGASNDHLIPDDNPFIDGDGPNLDEIWSLGLRNPFRAHWDIPNDRFYIGEVGGNEQSTAREDLHLGRSGANYGWPFCEGFNCVGLPTNPSITVDPPLYSYSHEGVTPAGGAIAAGFVYRSQPSFSSPYPSLYEEVFFFADYATGDINYLVFNADGSVASEVNFASNVGSPVALELGPDGALYAVDYIGERIIRYRFSSDNQPPVVTSATADITAGAPPLDVTFTATATDFENDDLTYRWFFGDGNQMDGQTVSHTYTEDGSYDAFVRVLDDLNSTNSNFIPINVGTPPVAIIDAPLDGSMFVGGDMINFQGSVESPSPGVQYLYDWDISFIHNDHTHPTLSSDNASGQFEINASGHDYHDDTGYRLTFTVTDESGLSSEDSVEIFPQKTDLILATQPSGLSVFIDGLPVVSPIQYDTMVNFNHTISVPQVLCVDGVSYEFDNWSDGGPRSNPITTTAADTNLTASFTVTGSCAQLPTNGLVAHFESDSGVISNGTDLLGWEDLSGTDNDLNVVQGDPSVIDNVLNGLPIVAFDGVGDLMRRTGQLTGFPTGSEDRTVFLVTDYRSTGYGGVSMGTPAPNQTFGLTVAPNGNLAVQGWGTDNDRRTSTDGTDDGWLTQSAVLANNQLTHFKNGVEIDSQTMAYNTTLGEFVVGAEIDLLPNIDMHVAAILVYNRALSEAEQGQVNSYIQAKYFNTGGANQPPIARDDSANTTQGGSVDIAVLVNDTDADDGIDPTSIAATQGQNGSVVALGNGLVRYTHDGGDSTSDSFSYLIQDVSGQASQLATVTLSITGGGGNPGGGIGDVPTAGLSAYYEADRGVTVDNENFVSTWVDQSGNGNTLSASGDPRLLDTGGPNAQPSIDFDGNGDLLEKIGLSGFATGSSDRSMYLVARYDGVGPGGVAYGSPSSNRAFGLVVSADGDLTVQGWGGANDNISTEVGTGADWLIQSVIVDANQGTHYLNGNPIDTFTETYGTTNNRLVVGAELGEPPFTDMRVAALFVYDRALDATENAQVIAYLDQKYGVGGGSSNQAPVAEDDTGTVVSESEVLLTVLSNDDDPDGELAVNSVQIVTNGAHGVAVANSDGTVTYTHDVGDTAQSDTFTYRVSDDQGAQSNLATVTLSITGGGGNPGGGIGDVPTAGLSAYYEADRGVTVGAGGVVTSWEDQSDNGNTLSVVGDPTLLPSGGLNGSAIIDFDGTGDALTSAALSGFPLGGSDRTVYLVASYESVGSGGVGYGLRQSNRAFGLSVQSEGRLRVNGFSVDFVSNEFGTGAGWLVQSAVLSGNQLRHFVDGVEIDSATNTYNTGSGPLVLGADLDQLPYVDMQVGALLIYDRALSEAEQQQVQNYLQGKYF